MFKRNENCFGGLRGEVTPVPIPNTAVKGPSPNVLSEENTWETRSPPKLKDIRDS